MRYCLDLSYDGKEFCGWQIQPGAPSVQEALEKALGTLLKASVRVTGAGRTDTDVSASGYVAHFDFEGPVPEALLSADGSLDCAQLCYKLNAVLPVSVAVASVRGVSDDFHARFGALSRRYEYYIHRVKDPFLASHSYYYAYPGLDFEAMNRAASLLLGTHDFSCFEKSGGDNKTSVCTVSAAFWERYEPHPCSGASLGECWRFVIVADRFLRNMVRAVVGTLLELGRGRRSEESFSSLILPPSPEGRRPVSLRSLAGESVPGHALFLTEIKYPE